jgi:hypothetical protein
MKVIVYSVTGNAFEAELCKESGVIEYANGEISHVVYEKSMHKRIEAIKEIKKEDPKEEAPSLDQSDKRPKNKSKAK